MPEQEKRDETLRGAIELTKRLQEDLTAVLGPPEIQTPELLKGIHEKAVARRDKALGLAFEAAMDTGQSFNVYHRAGQYKIGVDSQFGLATGAGWMFLAQVAA